MKTSSLAQLVGSRKPQSDRTPAILDAEPLRLFLQFVRPVHGRQGNLGSHLGRCLVGSS